MSFKFVSPSLPATQCQPILVENPQCPLCCWSSLLEMSHRTRVPCPLLTRRSPRLELLCPRFLPPTWWPSLERQCFWCSCSKGNSYAQPPVSISCHFRNESSTGHNEVGTPAGTFIIPDAVRKRGVCLGTAQPSRAPGALQRGQHSVCLSSVPARGDKGHGDFILRARTSASGAKSILLLCHSAAFFLTSFVRASLETVREQVQVG